MWDLTLIGFAEPKLFFSKNLIRSTVFSLNHRKDDFTTLSKIAAIRIHVARESNDANLFRFITENNDSNLIVQTPKSSNC